MWSIFCLGYLEWEKDADWFSEFEEWDGFVKWGQILYTMQLVPKLNVILGSVSTDFPESIWLLEGL